MTDVGPEDIAAMRRQGDLSAFMRHQIAVGSARVSSAGPVVVPPGYKPGVWPVDTCPPRPAVPLSRAAWNEALDVYRRWTAAGSPPGSYSCQCHPCRLLAGAVDPGLG